jgi:hypothetical protein
MLQLDLHNIVYLSYDKSQTSWTLRKSQSRQWFLHALIPPFYVLDCVPSFEDVAARLPRDRRSGILDNLLKLKL